MPFYEYECGCGYEFEQRKRMEDRHDTICPECGELATLKISLSDFRFAEPLTIFQDLGGNRGYQEVGWKPDCDITPPPGQPYKTAEQVQHEEEDSKNAEARSAKA